MPNSRVVGVRLPPDLDTAARQLADKLSIGHPGKITVQDMIREDLQHRVDTGGVGKVITKLTHTKQDEGED